MHDVFVYISSDSTHIINLKEILLEYKEWLIRQKNEKF